MIKRISVADVPQALKLFSETLADDWLVSPDVIRKMVGPEFTDSEACLLGVYQGEELVGCINVLPWYQALRHQKIGVVRLLDLFFLQEKIEEPAFVGGLAVRHDCRRQGLARSLLQEAERVAKEEFDADCFLAVTAKCEDDQAWPMGYAAATHLGLREIPEDFQNGDRVSRDLQLVWLLKDI